MYEHVEDDGDGDGGGDGDGDDDDEGEEEEEEDDDTEEEEQEEETGHKTAPHDWCKPAQSKCISRFHKRHQKSHFRRKFTGKMPRPRLSPERQDTHTHTAWEPAQSKRISRFHKSHSRIPHFYSKFSITKKSKHTLITLRHCVPLL